MISEKQFIPRTAGWKQKDVAPFRRALLAWYQRNARDLPWRRTKDPYRVWVSEIILQQTRVDQGTAYYQRFIKTFPSVQRLAAAAEDAVLKCWEGLGYYARARNLHKAAQLIAHDRQGVFPETATDWQRLPGVGRYTAGAVASIAYEEQTPVVDGNVIRVLTRLFDVGQLIEEASTLHLLWDIASALTPRKSPGDFNQAMMELGAQVCIPNIPACPKCPVQRWCSAHHQGVERQRPVRRNTRPVPSRTQVVAAIVKQGRYLICKRPAPGFLGGLWEFPGGLLDTKTSKETTLARHIEETCGLSIDIETPAGVVKHAYSHFKITVHLYRCNYKSGTAHSAFYPVLKWVRKQDFQHYAFHKAHQKCIALL